MSWRYVAVLLLATFFMGSSFIAGKILLATVPPFPLVGWRFVLAALALLPLAAAGGLALPRAAWPKVVLIGLFQTAAVMGLLFLSMLWIPAATAAILLFTAPIWVALLARLVLAEPITPAQVLGLLAGVAGVALAMGAVEGAHAMTGDLLALGSAFAFAAATIVAKRMAPAVPPGALTFWQMLVGAVVLLAVAAASGQRWPGGLTAREWAWFVWLAVPASSGSFGLWFRALEWGGAARTSAFLFLAPLFTVLLSHPILGERVAPMQLIGGVLIGASVYVVNRRPGPGVRPSRAGGRVKIGLR